MSNKCNICDKIFTKRVPGLECSKCGKIVHATQTCSGLSAKQMAALRNSECIEWTCTECQRHSPKQRPSFIIPDDDEEEGIDTASEAGTCNIDTIKLLKDITLEMKKVLQKELQPIEQSLSFCTLKIEELSKMVESQNSEIGELKKKYAHMNKEKTHLELKVKSLEQHVHTIDQQRLDNVLVVSGIPKTPNENVKNMVRKISDTLNINHAQVKSAKRIENRNGNNGLIQVVVNEPEEAVDWVRASRKNPVSMKQIVCDAPSSLANTTVFIRRALTKSNRTLLWQAHQKLRPIYKYIWFQDGKVLVRKGDNDKSLALKCEEDIEKISGLTNTCNT